MARLLDEGMDAGLCGFSIQRLGPNSVQADFDGSPMVTDTMCDEDILNLARVLRRRDEGFMEITQGTGDAKVDLAFVEKLADESQRPILWQAIIPTRNNPEIHRRSMRLDRAQSREGPADLRPGGHRPQRLRLHARRTGTSTIRCPNGAC